MIAHCVALDSPTTVVIRSTDSDVLAIAVATQHKLHPVIQLYMEAGLSSDNSLRFIHINNISKELGPRLSKAVAAWHALTGCDQNPSFSSRGKKKPFDVLQKNVDYQDAFTSLGSSESLTKETLSLLEKFACDIYPKQGKKIVTVNQARLFSFMKAFKPTQKNPLAGVKGIDGSYLPPCYSVLLQQILRTNYICSIWNNANLLNTGLFYIN